MTRLRQTNCKKYLWSLGTILIASCTPAIVDLSPQSIPPGVDENAEVQALEPNERAARDSEIQAYGFGLLFSTQAQTGSAIVDGTAHSLVPIQHPPHHHWSYKLPLSVCRKQATYKGRVAGPLQTRETPERTIVIAPGIYVETQYGANRARPGANNPNFMVFDGASQEWLVYDFVNTAPGTHEVTFYVPQDNPRMDIYIQDQLVPSAPVSVPISCGQALRFRAVYHGPPNGTEAEDVSVHVHLATAPIALPEADALLQVKRLPPAL